MKRRSQDEMSDDNATAISKRLRRQVEHQVEHRRLQRLANAIMNMNMISAADLNLITDKQNYTTDPRLALYYFHCSASNPNAFVHNNERIRDNVYLQEQLKCCLDSPPDGSVAECCQRLAAYHDATNLTIGACASCCELLIGREDTLVILRLDQVHANFLVTDEEFDMKYGSLPHDVLFNRYQIMHDEDGKFYFLNPDLVPDRQRATLCKTCALNPRRSQFTIANDHDYGRYGNLPRLNMVATQCVSPVRCFGIELTLSGKHSSGHAICFPSNGPQVCHNVLPTVHIDDFPRVTFIGPTEVWRIKKKSFRKLYELPVVSIYKWLHTLCKIHSYFVAHSITVDESNQAATVLAEMTDQIEQSIVIDDSTAVHHVEDEMYSERYSEDNFQQTDQTEEGANADILVHSSAVLKSAVCDGDSVKTGVNSAMLDALNQNTNHESCSSNPDIVYVQRDYVPLSEWDENGEMFAAAFPTLFLTGGHMLPRGSLSASLLRHLMHYYDGRFESNLMFVATAFNQLQRHSTIRKAAAISTSHANVLTKFGELASTSAFKQALTDASLNPESHETKRLNAVLLRLLSLVGGTVPFSPFERATTRPKIAAMRYKFGLPQHFVTVAPPEHDDLILHRVIQLRKTKKWNDTSYIYNNKECKWEDLPNELQSNARSRLKDSNQYPAQAAFAFQRCLHLVTESIIRCPMANRSRVSRNFLERETGAYGKVAGYIGVIEPQVDGRLPHDNPQLSI